MLVSLQCGIVGQAGSFDVEIDDDAKVSKLKGEIKEKNRETITCDAKDLHLFLAKQPVEEEGGEEDERKQERVKWLPDEHQSALKLVKGESDDYINALTAGKEILDSKTLATWFYEKNNMKIPSSDQIHVLVLVPKQISTGKRTRERDFFVDERMLKQPKVDGNEIQYFTMNKFPRMAHRVQNYNKVLERHAYRVIFSQLMGRVKKAFESRPAVHLAVTGNPGTGKSWFYLYCIFRLLSSFKDEVEELHSFDLVLNFDNDFQLYDPETKEFVKLNEEEVDTLCDQDRVLRLIEGKSSQLTGWSGVSILFASPGLPGMNDYLKVHSSRYIMPVWSFEELHDYNSLLDGELKLAEDVLISRYNKYGGIVRSVFTDSETSEGTQLKQAIELFDASSILSYVKQNHAVRDNMYSHRVIAMIPSRDDYLDEYYLDFLSNHIAEEIIFKMTDDSVKALSHFAIAQTVDDTGLTAVLRGKIYEIMCHRWFSIKLPKQTEPFKLNLRLLSSPPSHFLSSITFGKMETERFSAVRNIVQLQQNTYYRPTQKNFGALDAFILIGNDCIGLQMTINEKHGIKHGPLSTFLDELKDHGIAQDHFHFVFLVPSYLGDTFGKQTMRTKNDTDHQKPGHLADVIQYVAVLDVF